MKLPAHFLNERGFTPIAIISVLAILTAAVFFEYNQNKKPLLPPKSSPNPSPAVSPAAVPNPGLTPTPDPVVQNTPVPKVELAAAATPAPAVNSAPPGAGYSYQNVSSQGQTFGVSIIGADLNSTRVIVDTASDSDCSNDCPAVSLGEYASRSGAYAGINGSFFCPPEYPSCAGKTNSFDTLLMNKNKHYFNSDNNVYSTIPAAIFSRGSARFVSRSLEWGRDTGVDAVIANYPLLIAGGNINYTENPNEPKFGQRGARNFIAVKGNMVYIGVISKATMGEVAEVLKAMSMDEALNLDEGGSTALWFGGAYKAGPGRKIPNAVLFVNR